MQEQFGRGGLETGTDSGKPLVRINDQDFRLGQALGAALMPDQVHQFKKDGVFPLVMLSYGMQLKPG